MFDISWTEFLLIGIVALVVIGPKELPGVMRSLGQWTRKIRGMATEFQNQFQEAMREAEMADLKKSFDEVKEAATGFTSGNVMTSLQKDVSAALNIEDVDKPATSAEPAPVPQAPGTLAEVGEAEPPQPAIAPENHQEGAAQETAQAPADVELPRDAKAS